MAQAGQALKIVPTVKVTIDAYGVPDKPSIEVKNLDIVEFRSETDNSWEIDLIDSDGGDYFPLMILVPAHGHAYFVANSQQDNDECEYKILPLIERITARAKKPGPETNYVIIIGSGKGLKHKK